MNYSENESNMHRTSFVKMCQVTPHEVLTPKLRICCVSDKDY